MKLYRQDDRPRLSKETVFREPPFAVCMAFLIFSLIAIGSQAFLWMQDLWWFAILFIPLWLLVLPMLFSAARGAFSPENWVLRAGPEGLLLHFRSYRNRHFPRDCPTVAYLSWGEVASVSGLEERQKVPTGTRRTGGERRTRHFLELSLKSDAEELRQAVAEERERKAPKIGISRTKSHHYPVTVPSPGLVRVEFSGLRPGLQRALELFKEWAPSEGLRRLESDWERMEGKELDRFVARLYREGDALSASSIVRRRYGVPLNDAQTYLERLAREHP